jgi:hypothetical protein
MTKAELIKVRDEEIKKIRFYHACYSGDCPHSSYTECLNEMQVQGFNIAVAILWPRCLGLSEVIRNKDGLTETDIYQALQQHGVSE